MIEFFKQLFSKINFNSQDSEINKFKKIVYSVIILCAIVFIGLIVYFVIKQWPNFIEAIKYYWDDSKSILNGFTK